MICLLFHVYEASSQYKTKAWQTTVHCKCFCLFQVICSDRKPYHKACLKCVNCAIRLTPATLNEHDEKLFCNVCYERYFNPVEFTVDYYGGIVTPEDIERYAMSNFIQ